MGRGRQKAKQTRMARKLKYLTTDTDYDELAKELSSQTEETPNPADPFANVEGVESTSSVSGGADDEASAVPDDDLDEYAQWAAQAAAQAAEKPEVQKPSAMPKHKPIPMPVPSALKPKKD